MSLQLPPAPGDSPLVHTLAALSLQATELEARHAAVVDEELAQVDALRLEVAALLAMIPLAEAQSTSVPVRRLTVSPRRTLRERLLGVPAPEPTTVHFFRKGQPAWRGGDQATWLGLLETGTLVTVPMHRYTAGVELPRPQRPHAAPSVWTPEARPDMPAAWVLARLTTLRTALQAMVEATEASVRARAVAVQAVRSR